MVNFSAGGEYRDFLPLARIFLISFPRSVIGFKNLIIFAFLRLPLHKDLLIFDVCA